MTLLDFFKEKGFNFYTGVPCSEIKKFLADLDVRVPLEHILATREDEAIGIAAGAWLGGRTPLVYMQNSGFGNSINAINSLLHPYEINLNLLVTLHQGAEHQAFTYATTKPLLDAVQYRERTYFAVSDTLENTLVNVECGPNKKFSEVPLASPVIPLPEGPQCTRKEAIQRILNHYDNENAVFISTNGLISREHYALRKSRGFYMAGSMGLAPAIGLGLALTRPDIHVVVINGDGGYLMNLGVNATIAAYAPSNLAHIVLKNGRHETTGGQPLVDVPILGGVQMVSVTLGGTTPPRIDVPLRKIAYDLRDALCSVS